LKTWLRLSISLSLYLSEIFLPHTTTTPLISLIPRKMPRIYIFGRVQLSLPGERESLYHATYYLRVTLENEWVQAYPSTPSTLGAYFYLSSLYFPYIVARKRGEKSYIIFLKKKIYWKESLSLTPLPNKKIFFFFRILHHICIYVHTHTHTHTINICFAFYNFYFLKIIFISYNNNISLSLFILLIYSLKY